MKWQTIDSMRRNTLPKRFSSYNQSLGMAAVLTNTENHPLCLLSPQDQTTWISLIKKYRSKRLTEDELKTLNDLNSDFVPELLMPKPEGLAINAANGDNQPHEKDPWEELIAQRDSNIQLLYESYKSHAGPDIPEWIGYTKLYRKEEVMVYFETQERRREPFNLRLRHL